MIYFFYSNEQVKEKNNILNKTGKKFVPGTVVVNGKKAFFTQMSANKDVMSRFADTMIIAYGESDKDFTYIPTSTDNMKG